jgi:uncharacterized protein YutE (UPF0331/DUF86 family)/predicted nucleotidyltransferase
MINLEPYLPQLKTALEQHDVRLAYLFGSYAKGKARPDSDLDIAVLFDETMPVERYMTLRLALIGEMAHIFHRDDIDLVVLNEAPNLLACAVLGHGVVIYNADDRLRVQFQVRTLQKYRDLAPMRRLFRKALADQIKRGKFGRREEFVTLFIPKWGKMPFGLNTGDVHMTIDQAIIDARMRAMSDYAVVLRRYQAMSFDEIASDIGTVWAIEHGLQLCIQCAIDICNHLVAELNLGTPTTHREIVELLIQNGVLSADLGKTLIQVFGFRNILVHGVNLNTVYDILQTGLDDFARFCQQILAFLEHNGVGAIEPSISTKES